MYVYWVSFFICVYYAYVDVTYRCVKDSQEWAFALAITLIPILNTTVAIIFLSIDLYTTRSQSNEDKPNL